MPLRSWLPIGSLSARLLIPLLLTAGVVLAAHALLTFRTAEERFVDYARSHARSSSDLILGALHDGMLHNQKDRAQSTMERLVGEAGVEAIRIYDTDGVVALSAEEAEIGEQVGLIEEPCSTCHDGRGALPEAALLASTLEARGLRQLTVIVNEAACAAAGCHASPATQSVLGLLDVEMSMGPLEETVGALGRQTLWTMLGLLVIAGVVSTAVVRRLVDRPVTRLHEGTRRIARGDLDARITVPGRHELAELAEAFNRMAEELQDARREVDDWSRHLEEKVMEKTEEVQRVQRQVLHMEKMASLGKLSATVAHELNNPINAMLTYARLVERGLADPDLATEGRTELAEYVQLLARECSRCGTIVRNLLLFARRTGGAEMEPVDLNEIVERSLRLIAHHLEISGVRLDWRRLEGDPVIYADAGQVEQALVALFVNAVEAMGEEGGELTVRARGDGEAVTVAVRDTGVGIQPDVLPHIFEPFFSTKHAESGVGLGLAVVYGIVQRHGGSIEVESEPGQGALFWLRLPRRPVVDGTERDPAEVA